MAVCMYVYKTLYSKLLPSHSDIRSFRQKKKKNWEMLNTLALTILFFKRQELVISHNDILPGVTLRQMYHNSFLVFVKCVLSTFICIGYYLETFLSKNLKRFRHSFRYRSV